METKVKEKILGALRSAKSKLRMPKLRHARVSKQCEPVRGRAIGNQTTVTMTIENPDEPKPIKISIQGPQQIVKGLMEGEFSVEGQPHRKKAPTRRKGR